MSESLRTPRRQDAPDRAGDTTLDPGGDRVPTAIVPRPVAMRGEVFVYISGPITPRDGFTLEENIAAGVAVFLALTRRGIPAFCPHLCGTFTDISWGQWIGYDLAVLPRCTHVLLLPRWETSRGARIEKAYAEVTGIPVLTDIRQLDEP